MKFLITGGAGFLGAALANALARPRPRRARD
jgi:nucleoside-diphosphate-sugar epimerase